MPLNKTARHSSYSDNIRDAPSGPFLRLATRALGGVRVALSPDDGVILHECTPAVTMAVVVSGVVFVRECGLADDARHLVQRLYAGGTFGATFAALGLKVYPGMLVAEKPSVVLLLNVAAIRRMMEKGGRSRFLSNLYAAACTQGFYAWRKLMLLSIEDDTLVLFAGRLRFLSRIICRESRVRTSQSTWGRGERV